ncbi:MAG: hypothetical protein ACK5AO_05190 [bacterium]|jgi:hypothetical protein
METIHDWNDKIMNMIEKISHDHPELIKYIDEMPVTIPDDSDPHITISILREFYESLLNIERSGENTVGIVYTR